MHEAWLEDVDENREMNSINKNISGYKSCTVICEALWPLVSNVIHMTTSSL